MLQFQNIQYGYTRVEPRHGVDYVLDMILWFKKFRPPHRATLSVRRHAYIQQTFAKPEAISEIRARTFLNNNSTVSPNLPELQTSILLQPIYFVIPLKGRSSTFLRFTNNLKEILPKNDARYQLVVIVYR